jgi:hypothetical protein
MQMLKVTIPQLSRVALLREAVNPPDGEKRWKLPRPWG